MDLKAKTVHPEDASLPPLLLKLVARMQGQVSSQRLFLLCALGQETSPSISLSRHRVHGLQVPILRGFKPNEANAIDYVQSEGHELRAHFDDRLAHPQHWLKLCRFWPC